MTDPWTSIGDAADAVVGSLEVARATREAREEVDAWAFWKRSLAGERPEIYADYPQTGYYKARLREGGAFLPTAIWFEGDTPQCKVGYVDCYVLRDPAVIWLYCANHPITYATYLAVTETHQWPPEGSTLFDEAERIIAASDDGGELETLTGKLETARRAENEQHLSAKRMVDARYKLFITRIEQRLKQLKENEAA